MNISTGKVIKPQKVAIYGPEGIGKTTLASHFPDPLFVDTEGSTNHIDVKRVEPAPSSWSMLLGYVGEVIRDPSVCRTLVIDTADWAERLCVEHVLAKKQWDSIESPGYGQGYRVVNEEFGRLLNRLSDCVDKGVNVVVTAHARVAKFEQPDELGTYDRWTLKLFDSPKSSNAAMLKEWADLLIFCNYKNTIVQPDKKTGGKAKAMGGKRVMYTTHTPAWDAKNRCGLDDELPLDYASIASCIPSIDPPTQTAPAKATPAASAVSSNVMQGALAAKQQHEQIMQEIRDKHPKPKEPEPEPVATVSDTPNRDKLKALMDQANVTETMMQQYSGEQGFCPIGTPFDLYPEDFCGYLISDWQSIADEIGVPFK